MFYAEDIDEGMSFYTLTEEESKHCVRVLRMKVGDEILITNGRGMAFKTEIIADHPKRCELSIIEVVREKQSRDYKLHIAVAPTKNMERIEWFVEKATEIGIDKITMLICDNSERDSVKIDRLNKVAISAMKQSLRYTLPIIDEPIRFIDFVKIANEDSKFIAHCEINMPRSELKDNIVNNSNVLLVIGPEGDFSKREIDTAISNGFKPVSLGEARLRTETAALTGVIIWQFC